MPNPPHQTLEGAQETGSFCERVHPAQRPRAQASGADRLYLQRLQRRTRPIAAPLDERFVSLKGLDAAVANGNETGAQHNARAIPTPASHESVDERRSGRLRAATTFARGAVGMRRKLTESTSHSTAPADGSTGSGTPSSKRNGRRLTSTARFKSRRRLVSTPRRRSPRRVGTAAPAASAGRGRAAPAARRFRGSRPTGRAARRDAGCR